MAVNKFFPRLSGYIFVTKACIEKIVRWCADGEFLRIEFLLLNAVRSQF